MIFGYWEDAAWWVAFFFLSERAPEEGGIDSGGDNVWDTTRAREGGEEAERRTPEGEDIGPGKDSVGGYN